MTVNFKAIWDEYLQRIDATRRLELDRLIWGEWDEGGRFITRRDNMADKMENVLGKTLCPKCDKYILIESIKEHQRVGCAPQFHPGWCFICEKEVEDWPKHYAECKLSRQRKAEAKIDTLLDNARNKLREPGHYESIGQSLGALVDRKNKAYGDSFHQAGKCLEAMYPDGVPVSKYTDMLGVIRVLDKLFRIAKDKQAFDENPWRDIGGYSILMNKDIDK